MFKKVLAIATLAVVLSSCGTTPKAPVAATAFLPPANCNDTNVLSALPQDLTNAVYIPTEWQPADGTDLAAILGGGGIACTYGVQQLRLVQRSRGSRTVKEYLIQGLLDGRLLDLKSKQFQE
jgi:hypothetical protein